MLREIYRTVPLNYWKEGEHVTGLKIIYNTTLIPPYIETLNYVTALLGTNIPVPTGDTSIFLTAAMSTKWHPSWDVVCWRFDGVSGAIVCKYDIEMVGSALSAFYATKSRQGAFYYADGHGGSMVKFHYPPEVTAPVGESEGPDKDVADKKVIKVKSLYIADATVPFSKFEDGPIASMGPFGIDEGGPPAGGTYIVPVGRGGGVSAIGVWNWTTGKWRYDITVPGSVVDICMEDNARAYILLSNRTVLLLDYARGEILGASKIPPLQEGNEYGNAGLNVTGGKVRMSWDDIHRRLLLFEGTPDNADGSSTSCVRGYRAVPEPVRVTRPIPLKCPRKERIIPVLIQVLGDSNEGVGGYAMNVSVTGAARLVGIPLSDHVGNTRVQIACVGSPLFSPDSPESPNIHPSDAFWTSQDPSEEVVDLGLIKIVANATIYQPDPKDIPTSGSPGSGAGGAPGAPGGFIWAWIDQVAGAPAPDAPGDQAGAPGTMDQWESYFFGLIKKTKGSPANDYETVLQGLINQGAKTNPAKGEVPKVEWKFFGLSIMVSGTPRGRIWLPTATTNAASGGYYTHEIQVITNAPAGTGGGGGGEGGGNYGPNEMPNMRYIVDQVAAENAPATGKPWRLDDPYEWEPDGRGAFTGVCVQRMHDKDARFGHFNKKPPHNRYEGHAVDAVCFKNDDGLSQEGADIVAGGGKPSWQPYDRNARIADGKYNCWIWPADASLGTGK